MSENSETSIVCTDSAENGIDEAAKPQKATNPHDLTDSEFLRESYGDEIVFSSDGSDTLLMNGVLLPKKRPRGLSQDEMDELYDKMHHHLVKATKLVSEKDNTINNIRLALGGGNGDDTTLQNGHSSTALVVCDASDVANPAIAKATTATPRMKPGRKMYTIAKDHRHAILGKVRLRCTSWADNVEFKGDTRIITREKGHSGFPHVVRIGKSGATEYFVEHGRTFDVCCEIKYLLGGVFTDSSELLNHANQWMPSNVADVSELRFEMYLIYASGDGRHGNSEKPFASTDERSHFRPGVCIAEDYKGNTCTNLFTNFNPNNTNEIFYGACTRGRIVFNNIQFRKDALSSNVLAGDGAFRFVIRAKHPSLRDLVNYTALSQQFYVGARVRPTAVVASD